MGKIAAVTMTYNDGYKIKEWRHWYDEVKDEIDLYIVVDNGSDREYLNQVRESFSDAVLIERTTNGGCTAAYNDGIRYALQDKSVDAIMLFGNDVRFEKGSLKVLYDYLYSDERLGMVGPILLQKNSDIIDSFGVSKSLSRIRHGEKYSPDLENMIVFYVPGGANMAKRIFYENVGLQDENLFMYGDERDMAIRGQRKGFLEGVTASAKAWHQHISNPVKSVRINTSYMQGRNFVYLCKKHSRPIRAMCNITHSLVMNCVCVC